MRTQAVRLADDTIALLEAVAKEEKCSVSDVIRRAIQDRLTEAAKKYESIAKLREEAIAQRDEQHQRQIAEALGEG